MTRRNLAAERKAFLDDWGQIAMTREAFRVIEQEAAALYPEPASGDTATRAQLGARFGVCPGTISRWITHAKAPGALPGTKRFSVAQWVAWAEKRGGEQPACVGQSALDIWKAKRGVS